MSFDGNGNWTSNFYPVQDRDNGIAILASKFQTLIQENLKESFENCITRDGAGKPTTNINWNGNKITNLQNGTSSADAVNKSQLDAVSTAKVSKSGDTMTGDLTISKSDATVKLINDNSVEYDITSNDNGNLEITPTAGSGEKVFLNASDNYQPYFNDGTNNHRLLNVVESYTNGASWYRVWADGWCEQGGNSASGVQVTFLKPFADTNYTIVGMPNGGSDPNSASGIAFYNKTASSVYFTTTTNAFTVDWEAKGYIS